jgi:hypothetical protein
MSVRGRLEWEREEEVTSMGALEENRVLKWLRINQSIDHALNSLKGYPSASAAEPASPFGWIRLPTLIFSTRYQHELSSALVTAYLVYVFRWPLFAKLQLFLDPTWIPDLLSAEYYFTQLHYSSEHQNDDEGSSMPEPFCSRSRSSLSKTETRSIWNWPCHWRWSMRHMHLLRGLSRLILILLSPSSIVRLSTLFPLDRDPWLV